MCGVLFYCKFLQFLSDFSEFPNKKPGAAVYSLWPSEVLAVAMAMLWTHRFCRFLHRGHAVWVCECMYIIYHFHCACMRTNDCLLVFFLVCFSPNGVLLIVFTDFASLILHSIQFWSMHFMWLRFFFSFTHSSSSAYKYVCVFCSFSSARTHFFACSDILLYFSSLRVSDSAFWAAVFILNCM